MDVHAASCFDLMKHIKTVVLGLKIAGRPIDFGELPYRYMPLDVDTFVCTNSGTVKAYAGLTLTASRRCGAVRDTSPLLFRANSIFDSAKLMSANDEQALDLKREIAFIIWWNPRSRPVVKIGKNKAADRSTILPNSFTPAQIIALYAEHGTHMQLHSEFKTDMDLVLLPSRKFDTNHLQCALADVDMNMLRFVCQHSVHELDVLVRQTTTCLSERRANACCFACFGGHVAEVR